MSISPSSPVSNSVNRLTDTNGAFESQQSKRVLLCGHRSFAAQGLAELFEKQGHQVVSFSRGKVQRTSNVVTGPVHQIHENLHLKQPFDTVVNYILIKNEGIQSNLDYIDSLLDFCRRNQVRHLIHISSMSVYPASASVVEESTEMETDPLQKGSYGSLKVATDLHLLKQRPAELKVTLVRPGFILGNGLIDPIVGMAFRTPWNHLLLFGNAKNVLPLTTREVVHACVARAVGRLPEEEVETLLLADPNSPTRKEWLTECCIATGCGKSAISFPSWLWRLAGAGGQLVSKVLGLGIDVYKPISGACRAQRYKTSATAERLEMDLSLDWRKELREAMEGQESNFKFPYRKRPWQELRAKKLTYLGFGGVVQDLHLAAISKLNFSGEVLAYDLHPQENVGGHRVESIENWKPEAADLFVVATPGPVHSKAIATLTEAPGPVLIEKPLCYNRSELEQWVEFASRRDTSVNVCHNYRLKDNVAAMLEHLEKYNPGRLLHVNVHFQSPSVRNAGQAWMCDERRARTLLMDYSIHMLDLACMFADDSWQVDSVRHETDHRGDTSLIEGRLQCSGHSVSFLLRQGFMPRRAQLTYTFRNYQTSLGFFPETFVPWMTHDSPPLFGAEKHALAKATRAKVVERLRGKKIDRSHAYAYLAATGSVPELANTISLSRLRSFYEMLLDLAERVYGS